LDHPAFWVTDVHNTFERIVKKGATVAVNPFSEDNYHLAFVKDPDGIWIELIGKEKSKRTAVHK